MIKINNTKIIAIALAVAIIFFYGGCDKVAYMENSAYAENSAGLSETFSEPLFTTSEQVTRKFTRVEPCERLDTLVETDRVWGGIVSHHDITAKLLDEYFATLREHLTTSAQNEIQVFYVLSPAHFGRTVADVALTLGSWQCDDGVIETDKARAKKLCEKFEVGLDDLAFEFEHGIYTVVPFIKKHFPKAKILPILFDVVNNFSGAKIKRFVNIMSETFIEDMENAFLLISSDFSHKGDLPTTLARDALSAQYLANSNDDLWFTVTCDNAPGIRTFTQIDSLFRARFKLDTKVKNLYQTNALYLCPQLVDPNDITSYFFSYFCFNQGI